MLTACCCAMLADHGRRPSGIWRMAGHGSRSSHTSCCAAHCPSDQKRRPAAHRLLVDTRLVTDRFGPTCCSSCLVWGVLSSCCPWWLLAQSCNVLLLS